jgi:hypothetical protein
MSSSRSVNVDSRSSSAVKGSKSVSETSSSVRVIVKLIVAVTNLSSENVISASTVSSGRPSSVSMYPSKSSVNSSCAASSSTSDSSTSVSTLDSI